MKATVVGRTYRGYKRPIAVKKALCSDGIRRYARITGEPDKFFSIPASVHVQGKRVTGYITEESNGDYEFHAYKPGKNGHLLP